LKSQSKTFEKPGFLKEKLQEKSNFSSEKFEESNNKKFDHKIHNKSFLSKNLHDKTSTKSPKETFSLIFLHKILHFLDLALVCNPQNAPLLYFRSILFYELHRLPEALSSIELAIEKSEENIPDYYYLRGFLYAKTLNFKTAIESLSIVLQLNPQCEKALKTRAICYFLSGIKEKAFFDLKKFSEIKPKSSLIHILAGHFLIKEGAYGLATQAYTNSIGLKQKEKVLIFRAKGNIFARELNAALEDLDIIKRISKEFGKNAEVDIIALMALKTSSVQKEMSENLKGNLKENHDKFNEFDDKIHDKFNDKNHDKNHEKNLSENSGFLKGLEKFTILVNNKNYGLIFKANDLYLYKGLMNFYLGQWAYALEDFQKAWEIKKVFCEVWKEEEGSWDELLEEFDENYEENPENYEENWENSEENGENSEENGENSDKKYSEMKKSKKKSLKKGKNNEEMTDFSNNSFNIYEFYHNCMITAIKMKNFRLALDFSKKLLMIIPEKFKGNLEFLIKCIECDKMRKEGEISEGFSFEFPYFYLIFLIFI